MATEDATPDLLAELAADQGHSNGQTCSWRTWIDSLSADEAGQWQTVIKDRERFTLASVGRALKRRGVDIGRSTLHRHRDGVCKQCR